MDELDKLKEVVDHHIDEIRKQFKGYVNVSLLVRVPDDISADLIVTTDDLDELTKLIERSKLRVAAE